jgi:glyoxylase-like metal-dependent hydrolase (beta-lactamase superfamily II)
MPDLHLDVYVAPMRPMRGAPAQGPGDDPMWSPMSSTLIHGEHDAVLVDTLVAFDQVDALADWVQSFGKRLTAIYITHGHADHWIGLSRLLERFPDTRALAAGKVRERAVFEATTRAWPPTGNPSSPAKSPQIRSSPSGMTTRSSSSRAGRSR